MPWGWSRCKNRCDPNQGKATEQAHHGAVKQVNVSVNEELKAYSLNYQASGHICLGVTHCPTESPAMFKQMLHLTQADSSTHRHTQRRGARQNCPTTDTKRTMIALPLTCSSKRHSDQQITVCTFTVEAFFSWSWILISVMRLIMMYSFLQSGQANWHVDERPCP